MKASPRLLGTRLGLSDTTRVGRARSEADLGTPQRVTPAVPSAALSELQRILRNSERDAIDALRAWGAAAERKKEPHWQQIRALTSLIADILPQGWSVRFEQSQLYITAPPFKREGEDTAEGKARLRQPLLAARSAQLSEKSVRAFLKRMETPRVFKGRPVSVLDLVDDGQELATALGAFATGGNDDDLAAIVDPRVEVIRSTATCPFTGLSLSDVWRYFRHTWSLEYRPTPGRGLLVLVRNHARPNAPVMGIASLASAVPQLTFRDNWIGWSTEQFIRNFNSGTPTWPEARRLLLKALNEAKQSIRIDDIARKTGKSDISGTIRKFRAVGSAAAAERRQQLREREEQRERGDEVKSLRHWPRTRDGAIDWKKASSIPLFAKKRAHTYAEILFAESALRDAPDMLPRPGVPEVIFRAISIALREVRKVGLASRLLDLNVCGAVPPYRDLLVGKLMALAVASAEVASEYESRYGKQASEIASALAGREVFRPAVPFVLTTTSLYGLHASQYNRLKLKVDTAQGVQHLHWQELGLTKGFGTVHLSDTTTRALRQLATTVRGSRHVNNAFGEGNSPRLRQIREGLTALGIESDAILRHSSPRLVYGLELFPAARNRLLDAGDGNAPRAHMADIARAGDNDGLQTGFSTRTS